LDGWTEQVGGLDDNAGMDDDIDINHLGVKRKCSLGVVFTTTTTPSPMAS
jgi:hypothetical protein